MKKIVLLSCWLLAGALALSSFKMEDEDGKAGHVGSPGEQTCAKSTCHDTFAVNSGSGTTTISSPDSDIMAGTYTPGQTYTIQVTVAQTNFGLFGFGLEALNASNGNAGTLTSGTGSQIKQAMVSGVQRKCVTHTQNGGNTNNSKTWSFTWTAPTGTEATDVTLYCAGNAANEDDDEADDYVYTTSLTLTPIVSVTENILIENSVQVFPNPTNDLINITYSLSKNEKVFGRLYNSQGQLIKLLFAENNAAGTQNKQFDLTELAAGLYVLQLDAGQQTVSKNIQIQ
jgi:hypothetical protein